MSRVNSILAQNVSLNNLRSINKQRLAFNDPEPISRVNSILAQNF